MANPQPTCNKHDLFYQLATIATVALVLCTAAIF